MYHPSVKCIDQTCAKTMVTAVWMDVCAQPRVDEKVLSATVDTCSLFYG